MGQVRLEGLRKRHGPVDVIEGVDLGLRDGGRLLNVKVGAGRVPAKARPLSFGAAARRVA